MEKQQNCSEGLYQHCTNLSEHVAEISLKNGTHMTICLLCKEAFSGDDPTTVSTHFLGSSHKENLKTLFYTFIPNNHSVKDYSGNHTWIILNTVFDVSILLGKNISYVHSYENYVVCMICQDIICSINHDKDDLKDNIFNHIQSEQHSDNIKHNVSLVYQLETTSGFLMFHKTATFCSICDTVFHTQKNDTLQSAVDHLLAEHSNELSNKSVCNSDRSDDDSIGTYRSRPPGSETQTCIVHDTWEEISDDEMLTPKKNSGNTLYSRSNGYSFKQLNYSFENQAGTKVAITQGNNLNPFIITVQCSKKITFCVVCKDIIGGISSSNLNNSKSIHLWSSKHQEHTESLMFHCTPDPFSDKSLKSYNAFVSVLNNEAGCAFQCENLLMCRICNNAIANLTQSFETVKYDLGYHFGSKKHLKIMRENIWWYYYLQFSEEFVDFENHVSNCAGCSLNLESIPYHVVQCAREHLPSKGIMNRHDVSLDCNELICSVCNGAVDIYNNDPEFSMDLHLEKHKDLSEVNKRFDTKISLDKSEYTCPVCLEKILIFNKDIELSLSFHQCNANTSISYDASTIKLVSKHKKQDPWDLFSDNIDPHSLALMKAVIDENNQYIQKRDNFYFCLVCQCCFLSFGKEQEVMQIFTSHFLSKNHEKKMLKYVEGKCMTENKHDENTYKETDKNSAIQSLQVERNDDKAVFNKLKTLQGYQLNSLFLVVQGSDVYCKLCEKSVPCSNFIKVKKHCYSESHSMILAENVSAYIVKHVNRQLVNPAHPCNDKLVKVVKKLAITYYRDNNPTVTPHLMSIDNKGKHFFCRICNKNIKYSVYGKSLVRHFLTKGHKQRTYALCFGFPNSVEVNSTVEELQSPVKDNSTIDELQSSVKDNYTVDELQSFVEDKNVTSYNIEKNLSENGTKAISNTYGVPEFFEKLPVEYRKYRDFIAVDDTFVTCLLCGCKLVLRKCFEQDLISLQYHLSKSSHRERYQLHENGSTSTALDQSVSQDPWEKFDSCSDFATIKERQRLIDENAEYIEQGDVYFMCCLCNEYFAYFDEEDKKNNFAAHCLTTGHAKKLKKSTKFKGNNGLKINKSEILQLDAHTVANHSDDCHIRNDILVTKNIEKNQFVILLNKHYFVKKDSQYFCDICQDFIGVSESQLKTHCYRNDHKIILITNAIKFREGLKGAITWKNTSLPQQKFVSAMKKMAKNSYKHSHTTTGHLFFINYNSKGFFCCLCDKKINFPVGGRSATAHFMSKEHGMKVSKLCCIYRSHAQHKNSPTEKITDTVTNQKSILSISSQSVNNDNPCITPFERTPDENHITSTSHLQTLEKDELSEIPLGNVNGTNIISTTVLISYNRTSFILDKDLNLPSKKSELELSEKTFSNICFQKTRKDSDNCEDEVSLYHDEPFDMTIESVPQNVVDVEQSCESFSDKGDSECLHCNKAFTLSNDGDTKRSFEVEEFISTHKQFLCNKHFIKEIFDCLPEYYHMWKEVITVQSSTLYCSMCSLAVETERGNIFNSAVGVYYHLSLKHHNFNEKLHSRGVNRKQQRSNYKPHVNDIAETNALRNENLFYLTCKTLPHDVKSSLEHEFYEETDFDQVLNDEAFEETDFDRVLSDETSAATDVVPNGISCCDTSFFGETLASSFGQSKKSVDCKPSKDNELKSTHQNILKENSNQETCSVNNFHVLNDLSVQLENLTGNLTVHKEFLTVNKNKVTCKLCSLPLEANRVHEHVKGYIHKQEFLAKLKRMVGNNLSHEIKRFFFVNNQLHCEACRCNISPWDSFDSICQGVISHLETHGTSVTTPSHTSTLSNP